MKSRSSSVATILIPVLLALFLVSLLASRGQRAKAEEAEVAALAAHAEVEAIESLALRVQAIAVGGPADRHAGKSLERVLAETVSALMERRVEDSISIDTLAVTTGAGAARLSAISEMAVPVPFSGGQMRAVSVRIKGSYGHYQGLRDYLANLRTLPVAVIAFSASERSFEVMLTLFGS